MVSSKNQLSPGDARFEPHHRLPAFALFLPKCHTERDHQSHQSLKDRFLGRLDDICVDLSISPFVTAFASVAFHGNTHWS